MRWREVWGDMSYFDIPTVPFALMNFHFRGQSMSVTATLVLWRKQLIAHTLTVCRESVILLPRLSKS